MLPFFRRAETADDVKAWTAEAGALWDVSLDAERGACGREDSSYALRVN